MAPKRSIFLELKMCTDSMEVLKAFGDFESVSKFGVTGFRRIKWAFLLERFKVLGPIQAWIPPGSRLSWFFGAFLLERFKVLGPI